MRTPILRLLLLLLVVSVPARAVTPPVPRSYAFDGSYSNIVFYPRASWMDSSLHLTAEAWVYCRDLVGTQTFIARHYSTNLWFGTVSNRMRFFRSGGLSADSDGVLMPNRWTHVAASYDGARVRFYTNGVLAGDKVLGNAGVTCTNRLSLGGQYDLLNLGDIFAAGFPFNGYLDEVRLWSTARTGTEIASNLHLELRNQPGQLAAYGTGGIREDQRLTGGTTASTGSSRSSGFGILPVGLCIPRTSAALKVDGTIDLLNEYRGAETVVLRYTNNLGDYLDRPGYLIVASNATHFHLHVGIPDLALSGGTVSSVQLHSHRSPGDGLATAAGDWSVRLRQDGVFTGTYQGIIPLDWPSGTNSWQAAVGGSTEFLQNYELRIHGAYLNGFTNPVALLVRHRDVVVNGDQGAAPSTGRLSDPATWALADWCAAADRDLSPITVNGFVTNVVAKTGVAAWSVRLLSGPSELGAFVVATAVTTGANGAFTLSGEIANDLPYWIQLEPKSGFEYQPPLLLASGGSLTPSSTNLNRSLRYSACALGLCSPRSIAFQVVPPPGAMSITGMSTNAGAPGLLLRETPRKALPGAIVTLTGVNLHANVDVFLSTCTLSPPDLCVEGSSLFRTTVLSNDPARNWITVQLPEATNAFSGTMRWLIRDNWSSHPDWTRWVYGPNGFRVDPTLVPYPAVWGFEFANEGDGPSWEEFESVYGNNIFLYTPIPVRNPYYFTVWAPLYFILGETAGRNGSCHGMAAVSRMFERGLLSIPAFDVPGSGGPNGVKFPAGYPAWTSDPPRPFVPANWSGFDLFQPFRPVDLWAQIRTLMMAQFSTEAIDNYLDQSSLFGGDPVAVLDRVRARPENYVLCFSPGGFGGGHCVTPLGVVDNRRLDEANLWNGSVPAANFSVIRVYDNNYPGQERLMEINRTTLNFRYLLGYRDGDAAQPVIWSSRSMTTTPLSFYTSGRTAPGIERVVAAPLDFYLRYMVSGGADARHEAADGTSWGWDEAGAFTETYRGSRTLPGFFGFNTNRFFRDAFAFLPTTNPPTKSVIHVRGSNYLFHAGRKATTFQLMASNLPSGGVDTAWLKLNQGEPTGLRFEPGRAIGSWVPQLAVTRTNAAEVYSLQGLSLPSGHPVEWETLPGQHGARFLNAGSAPLAYSFRLEAVDGASGLVCSNQFGPFTLPAGARHLIRFPNWPQVQEARIETDLGADGTIDESQSTRADRYLEIQPTGAQLVLRWQNGSANDYLEALDAFVEKPVWQRLKVQPEPDPAGGWRAVVPAEGPQRFIRLRP